MSPFKPAARLLIGLALLATTSLAGATDLRISLPQLPAIAERDNVWLALARAIAREWKEGKATILPPVPFERSVNNVVTGRADVHFPLMAGPARSDDDLPYRYSSTTLSVSPFALYSRKDNERIDRSQLTIAALSRLRIETEQAHAGLFYARLREVDSVETGLQHVAAGQSDGFIFAIRPTERVLKRLKLDGIVRTPYRRFEDKMVLPKGPAGDELDEKLALIIDRLKDSGEYQQIMAPLQEGVDLR